MSSYRKFAVYFLYPLALCLLFLRIFPTSYTHIREYLVLYYKFDNDDPLSFGSVHIRL